MWTLTAVWCPYHSQVNTCRSLASLLFICEYSVWFVIFTFHTWLHTAARSPFCLYWTLKLVWCLQCSYVNILCSVVSLLFRREHLLWFCCKQMDMEPYGQAAPSGTDESMESFPVTKGKKPHHPLLSDKAVHHPVIESFCVTKGKKPHHPHS